MPAARFCLVAFTALSGCAHGSETAIDRRCGTPYSWDHDVGDSEPIPACRLPNAQAIADSCAVRVSGVRAPGGSYIRAPDYQADTTQCRFVQGNRSRADCSFRLRQVRWSYSKAHSISRWHSVHATFTYRYFVSGDPETSHVVTGAAWQADAQCSPAGPQGQLN